MSQLWLRALQAVIALAVVMGSIWFQQTYDYKINPFIIAGWAFMVPIAVTWLLFKAVDIRAAHLAGAPLPLPAAGFVLSVAGKTVLVLAGLILLALGSVYVTEWIKAIPPII